ncbi:hypothetical protein CBR_g6462 [Chara braunii]|uniref:Uncharacterized protein n=1 Tax=Chara braunii TaxID=69332 RepID=A0A388KJV3_CHABU|nr:hypothetical protein CBR_g6462 [Chara braunii]|eukprot:GBG70334.1 hypothetical protein CBR_g6462 [Chara braunii]
MAVSLVAGGHVGGRVVMAFEMRDLRDFRMGREFTFTGAVSWHEIRHYEIDARGELSLHLVVGLGYDGEYLRDVIVYVTKVHNNVPDRHVGAGVDIVECMVSGYMGVDKGLYSPGAEAGMVVGRLLWVSGKSEVMVNYGGGGVVGILIGVHRSRSRVFNQDYKSKGRVFGALGTCFGRKGWG